MQLLVEEVSKTIEYTDIKFIETIIIKSDAYIINRLGLKFRKIVVSLWNRMYRITSINYVIFLKRCFK